MVGTVEVPRLEAVGSPRTSMFLYPAAVSTGGVFNSFSTSKQKDLHSVSARSRATYAPMKADLNRAQSLKTEETILKHWRRKSQAWN